MYLSIEASRIVFRLHGHTTKTALPGEDEANDPITPAWAWAAEAVGTECRACLPCGRRSIPAAPVNDLGRSRGTKPLIAPSRQTNRRAPDPSRGRQPWRRYESPPPVSSGMPMGTRRDAGWPTRAADPGDTMRSPRPRGLSASGGRERGSTMLDARTIGLLRRLPNSLGTPKEHLVPGMGTTAEIAGAESARCGSGRARFVITLTIRWIWFALCLASSVVFSL